MQTRKLLTALDALVSAECTRLVMTRTAYRFSRRVVRTATGLSDTQCRLHLARLVELEYVLVHRGARGSSFVYELLYDGQGADGAPFVTGLLDVTGLQETSTAATSRGEVADLADSTRGHRAGNAASLRDDASPETSSLARLAEDHPPPTTKPLLRKGNGQHASYPHAAA